MPSDERVSITMKFTSNFPFGTTPADVQRAVNEMLIRQMNVESSSSVAFYTAKGAYRGKSPQDG